MPREAVRKTDSHYSLLSGNHLGSSLRGGSLGIRPSLQFWFGYRGGLAAMMAYSMAED